MQRQKTIKWAQERPGIKRVDDKNPGINMGITMDIRVMGRARVNDFQKLSLHFLMSLVRARLSTCALEEATLLS